HDVETEDPFHLRGYQIQHQDILLPWQSIQYANQENLHPMGFPSALYVLEEQLSIKHNLVSSFFRPLFPPHGRFPVTVIFLFHKAKSCLFLFSACSSSAREVYSKSSIYLPEKVT